MPEGALAPSTSTTAQTQWTEADIIDLHEGLLVKSLHALFDDRCSESTRADVVSWIRDTSNHAFSFRACCFAVSVNWEEMQDHLLNRLQRAGRLNAKPRKEEPCATRSSSSCGRHPLSALSELLQHSDMSTEMRQLLLWPDLPAPPKPPKAPAPRRTLRQLIAAAASLFGFRDPRQLALPL